MSGTVLPPPGEPPKLKDKRVLKRFLRFIVLGYFIGTALGVVGFALILLILGPEKVDVPWPYTILVLYQAGMIGGFLGAAAFMAKFKGEDDDDHQGGHGSKVAVSAPVSPAKTRKPATQKPVSDPGGALPQPV